MKRNHRSNRGQVLIIFVFAITALVAIVGLAVDGGNTYSDRRQAQNAADTAALAASVQRITWSKANSGAACANINTDTSDPGYNIPICAGSTVNTALNRAADNGYQNNGGNTSVFVYSPPIDGPYSQPSSLYDRNDYIEVVIYHRIDTYFARVLGSQFSTMNNRVSATALSKYSPQKEYYGGMTLVELKTGSGNCPSDFNVGGGGTVTLNGGGIWVNSSNTSCAYKQTSCNTTILGTGTIQVVGGADVNGCNGNQIQPTTGASPQYAYTPAHIFDPPPAKPPYCAAHVGTYLNGVFQPGDYQGRGDFPIGNANATLQPGVYCVDRLTSTKDITGDGVFIYIYPTSNRSQVDMSGGVIKLTANTDPDKPYAGYLIYADYDQNSKSNNPPTCTIAGGTNSKYVGMIWVPICNLVVGGNTTSTGESAQIIAAEISLSGTMNLTFTYDSSKFPKIPEENKTGLFR